MTVNAITDYERLYLLDEDMITHRYAIYQQLQQEYPPIFWSEQLQRWVSTRYADIKEALRNPRLSNERLPAVLKQLPAEMRDSLERENPLLRQANKIMLSRDDPDHARLRMLVNKAFTPRVVELQRPQIEQVAVTLLDQMGQRAFPDFIRDFALPFPVLIIAAMIGIPIEDLDQIKRWSDAGADFLGQATNSMEIFFQMATTSLEFNAYLRPHIEARRALPQDDLLSAFILAEAQGDRLSVDEMIANTFLLLAAGNETTTNLLGNGLWALLTHPDQMERLRQYPAFIETAVEEILRYESPSQVTGRLTKSDVEIAGQRIGPGQTISFVLGAANRDPAQFVNPESFDIARQENKHLAFGMGGHYCLGAPLARLEAQIAFSLLLTRYPHVRIARQNAQWRRNPLFLGLEKLELLLNEPD